MAKSKHKTKEIEYATKYLYETLKMEPKQIALELGVAEAIVHGIIDQQPEPKKTTKSRSQDLMIRHTSVKKTNNVSIMTEAASQMNDELRNKTKGNKLSSRHDNSIYRPNG